MAQELTPAQLERLKQQRAQKFKEMGLPVMAGQIVDVPVENVPTQRIYEAPVETVQESTYPQYEMPQQNTNMEIPNERNVAEQIQIQLAEERAQRQAALYTAPRDKFNALEAIRKGAKKQEFRTFLKAESNGGNGNQLPEPKVGKRKPVRPGQPQEKSAHAVAVQTYNAPKNTEADMLEGMFTDKTPVGINVRSSGALQGNLIETDENYSNIGPSFDPVAHLKAKAAEKGVNIDFSKKKQLLEEQDTPQVFQTDNSNQLAQMMLMMETMMKNQQKNSNYDIESLKEMMVSIARKVAEDTMKKVLREYVETQKKKNVFEVVNPKQNVVKIEGKYYQLKPVTLKS